MKNGEKMKKKMSGLKILSFDNLEGVLSTISARKIDWRKLEVRVFITFYVNEVFISGCLSQGSYCILYLFLH